MIQHRNLSVLNSVGLVPSHHRSFGKMALNPRDPRNLAHSHNFDVAHNEEVDISIPRILYTAFFVRMPKFQRVSRFLSKQGF